MNDFPNHSRLEVLLLTGHVVGERDDRRIVVSFTVFLALLVSRTRSVLSPFLQVPFLIPKSSIGTSLGRNTRTDGWAAACIRWIAPAAAE